MPCAKCKKKCGVAIKCAFCPGEFCARCRHMEIHECPGIEHKKNIDRQRLQNQLKYDVVKQSGTFQRV